MAFALIRGNRQWVYGYKKPRNKLPGFLGFVTDQRKISETAAQGDDEVAAGSGKS